MTKKKLFKKYNIDKSHNVWDNMIDNWYSVELFREMHDGKLPEPENNEVLYVLDFLDKMKDVKFFMQLRNDGKNAGSLFLTAKRMVYCLADQILNDLAQIEKA